MPRMLELIKQSAVPANIMRSAAHGALSLPAAEMVEILVYLSKHSMFGEDATIALASWDEKSLYEIASDPRTPLEVLDHLIRPSNIRIALLPALLQNRSVTEDRFVELAKAASPAIASVLLGSDRILKSQRVLRVLRANDELEGSQKQAVNQALMQFEQKSEKPEEEVLELPELDEFLAKHAAEIEAEQAKEFQLFRNPDDEKDELDDLLGLATMDAEKKKAEIEWTEKHARKEDQEKLSTLQKIAKLTVGERVQLAMKGSKDERFILVRDGSKVVSLAVLESPKLSDSEMEMFASMKNVQEAVLRGIASKRKFMKNYSVIRALVNNPRLPLDVSLPLLPHLLAMDLKHLTMNKNVSETLRKLALKLFRDKTQSRKQ